MNLGKRFTAIFFSLLGLVFALLIFLAAVGWLFPIDTFLSLIEERDVALVFAALSFLVVLWAIYSVIMMVGSKKESKYTLINTTSHGQIHITPEALEEYIDRAVASVKEIKEVRPKINTKEERMNLLLRVSVYPETVIPDATKAVQENVAQYLKEYGGMEIGEIEVVIDKIAQPTKSRVD